MLTSSEIFIQVSHPALKPMAMSSEKCQLLGEELLAAVEEGDSEVVLELILDGANVDYASKRGGTTALSKAAIHNRRDVVDLLIRHGAQLNKYRGQALRNAVAFARNGKVVADLSCVSALIEAGANVNLVNRDGGALHEADCPSAISLLHIAGIDLELRDEFGRTALMLYAFNGNFECFKLLHSLGARLDVTDNYGQPLAFELDTSCLPAAPSRCKAGWDEVVIAGRASIRAYMASSGGKASSGETLPVTTGLTQM